MINKLIALANDLDDRGHNDEASGVDSLIDTMSNEDAAGDELHDESATINQQPDVQGDSGYSDLEPSNLSSTELKGAAAYWINILSNAVDLDLDNTSLHDIIGHMSASVRNFPPEIKSSLGLRDTDGE
jgi:hypothetical protein